MIQNGFMIADGTKPFICTRSWQADERIIVMLVRRDL